MHDILQLLHQENALFHQNQGLTICTVPDAPEAMRLVKQLFYKTADRRTAMYLSGGKTPQTLYEQLAQEEVFSPGCVGMVDERFGEKFHPQSNETMMRDTQLLRYLQFRNIQFYPMLQGLPSREETAKNYDELVRSLQTVYQRHVALVGIGIDGHTAGIAPNRPDFKNPLFESERKNDVVSEFSDEKGPFKERVTMTFLGLSMMDSLILLVLGEDKKQALEKMFEPGREETIPDRFYLRPQIASRTVLITDQQL